MFKKDAFIDTYYTDLSSIISHFCVLQPQICIITQILYRLFECYIHHFATVNILPKMAASSVISVKTVLMDGLWL